MAPEREAQRGSEWGARWGSAKEEERAAGWGAEWATALAAGRESP